MTFENLLEIKNLKIQFHSKNGIVYAVNNVGYRIGKGETLGVVGESGSGKTVSAKSIIHLLPRNAKVISGSAIINGVDLYKLNDEEIRKIRGNKIGIIFQDPMSSLNPVLTIGYQIVESLRLNLGMNKNDAKKRAAELLTLVGIPNANERLNEYPHQFSGGMRQRVMIALGISCNPELLIADEATTALDVTIQAQIIEVIKEIRRQTNMSIIWISHDLAVVAGIADRVVVMYAGYVVEDANVDVLFSHPLHPYTVGLLDSIPKINSDHDQRLISIDGTLPDSSIEPQGCPFYDRCKKRMDICKNIMPELKQYAPEHFCACHLS